jgi:hypothetical protein
LSSGLIQLRELLSLTFDINIVTKTVGSASYHAILQELKEKEIYNMIVDIRNNDMSDFLKAVSKRLIFPLNNCNQYNTFASKFLKLLTESAKSDE